MREQQLHILILNYEYPPLGGGAGIVTKHLAEEFVKLNHKVCIVTTWFEGEQEHSQIGNLEIIRLKCKRQNTFQSNPFEMLDWIFKTKKYFSENTIENKFDVCLANFTLPGGEVAQFLKRKYKLPYIILSHGHDIPWAFPKKMFLWHLLSYFKIKQICNAANYTILLSDDLKKNADKFLPNAKEKNIVIDNGLSIQHFKNNLKSNEINILFVGRLVEQKNPLLFLETMKQLQDANISYNATILGDGELRREMELYINKNNIKNITLKGKVQHEDVLETLKNTHLLVVTSKNEGMALAILEALAYGVYVISTDVSGTNKLIIENINGHIVKEQNSNVIVNKIIDFYTTKLSVGYTYPENYKDELEQKFSWTIIAEQYLELFKNSIVKIV